MLLLIDNNSIPICKSRNFIIDKDSAVDILSRRLDYLMKVDTGISEQMKTLETQKIPADVKCNVNHNKLLVKAEIAAIQEHIEVISSVEEW